VKRKNKVMLDEKMSKVAKGERKTKQKNRKEKCSFGMENLFF
jgi:hypothetical protein